MLEEVGYILLMEQDDEPVRKDSAEVDHDDPINQRDPWGDDECDCEGDNWEEEE